MQGTWLVTIPPLLVVFTVFFTRRMLFSLLVGLAGGALIACDGNILEAASLGIKRLFESTGLSAIGSVDAIINNWNLLIFSFLICIGILITLLGYTGAAQAYAKLVHKRVKTKKQAQAASLLLSLIFFIDDYFSALTVGSVMRPVAALYKIHPVKLAFLTTAMATPLTILSPISSWVGEIMLQFKQVGISQTANSLVYADPFYIFVCSIPFITYAIFMLISTWYIVLRSISYGPMKQYETATAANSIPDPSLHNKHAGSLLDFFFPIIALMMTIAITLLATGNWTLFGGTATLLQALKNGSMSQALALGGIVSVIATFIFLYVRKKIKSSQIGTICKNGVLLMYSSILMLICAWGLGSLLKNDLKTGFYIAHLLGTIIHAWVLPLICFSLSALIATLIGSAWAAISLMLPIVVPMLISLMGFENMVLLEQLPLLLPVIGATLSGCILGTHISLIADNPIMAAASTGADHLEHIKTLFWYAFPAATSSALAYTIIGIGLPSLGLINSSLLGFACGAFFMIILLEVAHHFWNRK